jgi:hypothetical protein
VVIVLAVIVVVIAVLVAFVAFVAFVTFVTFVAFVIVVAFLARRPPPAEIAIGGVVAVVVAVTAGRRAGADRADAAELLGVVVGRAAARLGPVEQPVDVAVIGGPPLGRSRP